MACWSSTIPGSKGRAVLLLAALAAFSSCKHRELPDRGPVPDFSLTSQTGAAFEGSSLDENVWVAEFFFTHCTGPCPRMNARFRMIQNQFADAPAFRLVSFTVDPARDNVAELAVYAHRFQAQPGRWNFLTGPMDRLNHLSRDVFNLGNVDGQLDHSTRFILVGRHRRIRGYYRSNDAEEMKRLLEDIRWLLREKA